MIIDIYTDGSCRNNKQNSGTGAWAFIGKLHEDENDILISSQGHEQNTTNQRMEMMAVIRGCQWGLTMVSSPFDEIHIYTDSAYVNNCFAQKWYRKWLNNHWVNSQKQPVANQDLWEKLIPFFDNPCFSFHKVAGHKDNKWNNMVDEQAQALSMEVLNGSNN